jgi:hypothetical protein
MLVKTSRGRSLAKQGRFDKPQTMNFAHLPHRTGKAAPEKRPVKTEKHSGYAVQ